MAVMKVLFLENDDSFSWNVVDRLPFARNDIQIVSSPQEALGRLSNVHALVIGPGPRDPIRAELVTIVTAAARLELPTLGICLGHQALGLAFDATLVRTAPMHGMRSTISFEQSRFFPAFQGPTDVMRYHSLALSRVSVPLRVVASTREGIPMAIEHERLPMAGLQFHPDSFATPRGEEMLRSFFRHAAPEHLA